MEDELTRIFASWSEKFMLNMDRLPDRSECFEAGRESVIANRWTYQKVRAEGVREGMEKAAVLVGQAHHTAGNVFESLAISIRKEIDNER